MKSGIAALLSIALAAIIILGALALNNTAPKAQATKASNQNKTLQGPAKIDVHSSKPSQKDTETITNSEKSQSKTPAPSTENKSSEPNPHSFPARPIDNQNSPLKEASPEELDKLENLILERDGPGLLSFFKKNKTVARFEALRRFMEVQGQESIPVLIDLLKTEKDPGLHGLLGDALGAGAQSNHIPAMSLALQSKLPSTARLAFASAFTELSERLHPASQRQCQNLALKELRVLSRNKEWGEAAISQLPSCGSEGLDELEKLIAINSIPDSNRLLAATLLAPSRPSIALKTFQDLAKNSKDQEIRAVAAQYATRSKGSRER